MEKEFNEQESLKLITDMITQARKRFQQQNGNGIIFWGYAVMTLALANFILLQALEGKSRMNAYLVWTFAIPLFAAHYFLEARKAQSGGYAGNHLNDLIGHVWLAFLGTNIILVASTFILADVLSEYRGVILFWLITPAVMSITGLCLFLNGKICRFPPFVYGAVVFWAGALLSAITPIVWKMQSLQFLVLAFCMILGFIVPGHVLNRKARQDV
ncbi:MAG: hypothetical protein LBJ60_03485 [Tannerellaceae bacterium]|jgi:hypothetical protein|nr:hypothetical protein [Tannerellaceae bacterium]